MECVTYLRRTVPSLPSALQMPSVVTHITPFHKDHLAILPSLAIFPQVLYPLPALTYQTILDLNAACPSKRTET